MSETAEVTTESTESTESIESQGEWTESFSDEHKEAFSRFGSEEELFEALGYGAPEASDVKDWRDGLEGDEKETADRFASPGDAIRSIQASRKRESLIRVPGKDATDEDRATYYKAIGVPETPEGYVFKLLEGEESTPEIEAENKEWGEVLHKANVPVETVNTLIDHLQKKTIAMQEAETKADSDFVADSEATLKSEWKGEEYEKNVGVANKAFKEIANRAGLNLEELKEMQTKEGRFLNDDPRMVRMFAAIGRDMAEGTLGPTLSNDQRDTMQDQLTEIRGKVEAANLKGNSKDANRFYKQEMDLIAKMDGNKPIN